jgi:6-phosphofructokinase 2
LDESANCQYRFGMPGPELEEAEWKSCLDAMENEQKVSFIIMSGSLTPGMSLEIFSFLKQLADKKSARLVIDTSGPALRAALEAGAYLFKPNMGELAALAERYRISREEAEGIARGFIRQGKATIMVVSMAEEGAMLITAEKTYHAQPPKVERKSTVGAGDSSVAGLVYSLAQQKDPAEVIRYGVAAGTSATMNPGTELCRPEDISKLLAMMN